MNTKISKEALDALTTIGAPARLPAPSAEEVRMRCIVSLIGAAGNQYNLVGIAVQATVMTHFCLSGKIPTDDDFARALREAGLPVKAADPAQEDVPNAPRH